MQETREISALFTLIDDPDQEVFTTVSSKIVDYGRGIIPNLENLWEMSPNFGGLSGVVYGLLGYIWMWQTVIPSGRLRLPLAMIGFMLVALVLMEVFASSWIASAAHAGGLFAGMMAGLLTALLRRFR